MFRWSGTDGKLLVFEELSSGDVKLLGQASADSADAILNLNGWKPSDTTSRFEDWLWRVAYIIGCRLRLPGFHKRAPSESDDRSASA